MAVYHYSHSTARLPVLRISNKTKTNTHLYSTLKLAAISQCYDAELQIKDYVFHCIQLTRKKAITSQNLYY